MAISDTPDTLRRARAAPMAGPGAGTMVTAALALIVALLALIFNL